MVAPLIERVNKELYLWAGFCDLCVYVWKLATSVEESAVTV
jgi:hypothetical protein